MKNQKPSLKKDIRRLRSSINKESRPAIERGLKTKPIAFESRLKSNYTYLVNYFLH